MGNDHSYLERYPRSSIYEGWGYYLDRQTVEAQYVPGGGPVRLFPSEGGHGSSTQIKALPKCHVSVIPCSQDGTSVCVDWEASWIRISDNFTGYNFPFSNCWIRVIWTQSAASGVGSVRRCVLCVRSYANEWRLTLAPETPIEQEKDIPRLAAALKYIPTVNDTNTRGLEEMKPKTGPLHVEPPSWNNKMQPRAADWEYRPVLPRPRVANIILNAAGDLTRMLESCKMKLACDWRPFDYYLKQVHGSFIDWDNEPIFPMSVFCYRHGQQSDLLGESAREWGPPLSPLGETQASLTSEFISRLTRGFKGTLAVWSSSYTRSIQTAGILQRTVKTHNGPTPVMMYNSLFGEFAPPYDYDTSECPPHIDVAKELKKDAKALEDGVGLVSAALRGTGAAIPPQHNLRIPLPTSQGGEKVESMSSEIMYRQKFPPYLSHEQKKILGVFVGRAPSMMSSRTNPSVNCIYVGHGNAMRFQVLQQFRFPTSFWRRVQIPHCAVIPIGMHISGDPGMIIGDFGYLTSTVPMLPITFTPKYDSKPRTVPTRHDLLIDQNPDTPAPEKEWPGRPAMWNLKYNAPPLENSNSKNIILLRSGHSEYKSGTDAGLSMIGAEQLSVAATWIAEFVESEVAIKKPSRWCVTGLAEGDPEASLKQSVTNFTRAFDASTSIKQDEQMPLASVQELTPQQLFGAAERDGDLLIIIADEMCLLRYFAQAFGLEPRLGERFFWPHAAHVLITVTEEGWPEMRTFGTLSHMPVSMLSVSRNSEGRPMEITRVPSRSSDGSV